MDWHKPVKNQAWLDDENDFIRGGSGSHWYSIVVFKTSAILSYQYCLVVHNEQSSACKVVACTYRLQLYVLYISMCVCVHACTWYRWNLYRDARTWAWVRACVCVCMLYTHYKWKKGTDLSAFQAVQCTTFLLPMHVCNYILLQYTI